MKTPTYKVVEIFKSIEGEGRRAGLPCIFIRLFGCNLRCSYCDTMYSVEGDDYSVYTLSQIVEEVLGLECDTVTITGGEPLIQPHIKQLIDTLSYEYGCYVNIETNGSVDVTPYLDNPNVMLTIDYKCPSSGMEDKMLLSNFNSMRPYDVAKFVVGSIEDLDKANEIINNTNLYNSYISPIFGSIEPKQIAEYIINNKLNRTKIQLQLHKYIWEPDKRGV